MRWRLGVFLLWQLAGAVTGWLIGGRDSRTVGVLGGMLAGTFIWFAIDFSRASRLLGWLREGAAREAPTLRGAWGEAADRVRRFFRGRDRQLLASDDRLRHFLEGIQASPNGVLLLDAENRIEWCSATAASHLGLDAGRDLLQHIGNLVRTPAFVGYLNGRDWRREVVIESRNVAAPRPSRISLQLHPYGEGHKLVLSRDVTALEQAEAMRRDFVANVSHEIRSPLTVVAGFIETLRDMPEGDGSERQRYLELMARQTDRMKALVDDLLTLSRLEGSPPPSASETVAASSLMERVAQEARALSEVLCASAGRGHDLSFAGGEDFAIAGSSTELRSAMANLVNNAVRYTPPGGLIRARFTLLAGGRAEFSVQDGGPGIPPEHLPRLTERFYRVDSSRSRETGGTGLGLAIVKHVAQRHGAELRIDSALGKGSRFSIVFPAGRVRKITASAASTTGAALPG
ncbi:MAG: phosphate regulon sensor histidine kinase PhoR [Burkholderiales bacterium]